MISLSIFQQMPHELAVFCIAMLPIAELRGAIPAGINVWHLPWWRVAPLAVIGNMVPIVFIVYFLDPVARFVRARSRVLDRMFHWLFERTQRKFYNQHARWGDLGLVIFVAIPLPMTGAWTGAIASFLFGMKPAKALFLNLCGVIIASVIVTAASLGVIQLFSIFTS